MGEQGNLPESESDFDALVGQCLARIQASGREHDGEEGPAEPEALARRVARIVSANQRRGRVPRHEAADPQTGVPDSYIDEVLFFLRKEEPTLRALRAGDEAAWIGVLEILRVRAYGYLMRHGMKAGQARQLAHDFAQTCAVTLWEQALERFPYDTHFDAWVSRIVAYEVSQWRRSTKEQREQHALSLDGTADPRLEPALHEVLPDMGASQALDAAERRMVLDEALEKLPSENQRQMMRRQLAGQSDQEIAKALGRSRQAIYNLRHRALRALRRILGVGRDSEQDDPPG